MHRQPWFSKALTQKISVILQCFDNGHGDFALREVKIWIWEGKVFGIRAVSVFSCREQSLQVFWAMQDKTFFTSKFSGLLKHEKCEADFQASYCAQKTRREPSRTIWGNISSFRLQSKQRENWVCFWGKKEFSNSPLTLTLQRGVPGQKHYSTARTPNGLPEGR